MREKYELLVQQVAALIQGEKNKVSVLSNVSAALHEAFPERFFWVGFYMVEDGELQLGPFQGSVACMHIKKGKGVCGTSWEKAETIIVPDVELFPGHIACSSLSRSEIVVPMISNGEVIGVLDIDSPVLARFSEEDEIGLAKIAAVIEKKGDFYEGFFKT
jgi:GAF domain-containing protein